jgi:hypothetical protein
VTTRALERALVGWNRCHLDLDSDEVLAQILDRGDLAAWVARMREIVGLGGRIDHVQVYTVARAPSDPRCSPLDAARLEAIAAAARAAGLAAAVYA